MAEQGSQGSLKGRAAAPDEDMTLALAQRLQGLLSEVELSREKVRFLEETIQLLSKDLESKKVIIFFMHVTRRSITFCCSFRICVFTELIFPGHSLRYCLDSLHAALAKSTTTQCMCEMVMHILNFPVQVSTFWFCFFFPFFGKYHLCRSVAITAISAAASNNSETMDSLLQTTLAENVRLKREIQLLKAAAAEKNTNTDNSNSSKNSSNDNALHLEDATEISLD
jgi:hypothetical protein